MPGIFGWLREVMREYDRGTAVMRGRDSAYRTGVDAPPPVGGIKSEVELLDDGSRAVVSVRLPDISPEDVDVTLSRRDVLTVSGLVRAGQESTGGRSDAALDPGVGIDGFREVVPLPPGFGNFDNEATNATFEDGVLRVTFSRTESGDEESRRVPLQDLNG